MTAEGIRGMIIAVDDTARRLALVTPNGVEMSFRLSGRAAAQLCDLKLGEKVTVRVSLDLRGAGELTATELGVGPA